MIVGRITAKAQTTIPRAVRLALGLAPGDDVAWEIDGNQVVMTRVHPAADAFVGNFDTFAEWSSDADCAAFDHR
ncbi:type II toxin-antitoxin system PrlF family antitoxin [Novosphingobium sp.]|uniref:AbrB/MazE/SpoVT family DNA-binding domain-containing protein n=1 Tax=Novosphingobium sp. TaxID=1874826 RepID=UPI0025F5AE7A|nr:type II toxin-antitoxin system PrlF family antitoxin [Novosphingobium sp.]